MKKVLILDSDKDTIVQIKNFLSSEGYGMEILSDGIEGCQKALNGDWSAVLTESTLTGMNGFDLIRKVREESNVPIIMISRSDNEVDRILALEFGADDYVSKPLPIREFMARFRALMRRCSSLRVVDDVKISEITGDIHVFPKAHCAYKGDQLLDLSNMEYRLLEYLIQRSSAQVTREELVRNVMGREYDTLDRSVDMHISCLRKKIGPYPDGSSRIRTIRGVGYLYALPATPPEA